MNIKEVFFLTTDDFLLFGVFKFYFKQEKLVLFLGAGLILSSFKYLFLIDW